MNHLNKEGKVCCGMLLQPPPGDLTGPYPALPYLKSYAELHGHSVKVHDLGIEALYFLSGEDKIRNLFDTAMSLRKELESKRLLNLFEQVQYRLLVTTAWLEAEPDLIAKAFASFKNSGQFYNYRLYRQASRVLDAFYGVLSAIYYPTVVTPSEYPTAQALNSMEEVLKHRHPDVNPYMGYYEEILFHRIAAENPRAIGISMEFASQSVQALVLGYRIKELFPLIHVTMGGAYLSQWIMLIRDEQLSQLFSCTDSVICGEGEVAFSQLLDRLEAGLSPARVPNLIFQDPLTREFCRAATLEYPDVEALPPPDYSDLDLSAYLIPKPVIPYCISRGCYWGKCVFCQNRYGENQMRRYQAVSVEKAMAEMSQLAERYGSNHFNFSNDVVDPPYLRHLSEALIASKKKFVWNTDLRAEKTFSRNLCDTMARAGLNSVAIGFESACQKTLDAMNKGKRVETVRQVLRDLHSAGVATQAMGFFGFPGETEEDAEATVTFLEENVESLSYYVIGLLMIVPGSRMHEEPQKYGVTSISYEGNSLMAPMPVWRSNNRISARAVNRLYHRLSHLEEFFAINEYPYAGALSTNHSFLYFETGPDVLKRIRREENDRYFKLLRILDIRDRHARTKRLKSLVPRFLMPLLIYRSRFPVERINLEAQANARNLGVLSGTGLDYVIGPSNMVIQIGEVERRFLEAINGKKNLRSLLSKFEEMDHERLVAILLTLSGHGLVTM